MDYEGMWKQAGVVDRQDHQVCEVSEVTAIRTRMPDRRRNQLTTIYPGCVPLGVVDT